MASEQGPSDGDGANGDHGGGPSPSALSFSLEIPHPTTPDQTHFLVNFPGYVRNEGRTLETLGGLSGLAAQRQSHPKSLHLRLRPGDPSCHALISDDVRPTTSIVVRLARPSASEQTGGSVTAEVVAVADKAYSFSAPADFQYAGRDRRPAEIQWVARPERAEDDPDYIPRQPLLCTPSLFAVEPAVDYAFKQYRARDSGIDVLGRRPKRPTGVAWVDFFAKEIPGEMPAPAPAAVPQQGTAGGQITEAISARVQELLMRRPVYLEAALRTAMGDISTIGQSTDGNGGGTSAATAAAGPSQHAQQQQQQQQQQQHPVLFPTTRSHSEILARLCYRFKNGPWKGTWVRRGYDPRIDPGARQYQVLDYSLPAEWWKKVLHLKDTQADPSNSSSIVGLPPLATTYPALCAFTGVQATQSTQLQLCDINDPQVRKSLADTANVAAAVNDGTGWLTQASWEGIKSQVAQRFEEVWQKAASAAATGGPGRGAGAGRGGGILPPALLSELATYLEAEGGQGRGPGSAGGGGGARGEEAGAEEEEEDEEDEEEEEEEEHVVHEEEEEDEEEEEEEEGE